VANPSTFPAAILGIVLAASPTGGSAEPYRMDPGVTQGFQAFDAAVAGLKKGREALAAIEAGERPKDPASTWQRLPEGLAAAVRAMRVPEGTHPPEIGAGPTIEQLRACDSRPGALTRLERHHRSLVLAAQRGVETRNLLRERLGAVQAAEESLRDMAKVGARLAGNPLVLEAFPWNWQTFETSTAASVGAFAGEIRSLLDRVDRTSTDFRARGATEAASMATFGQAKDCQLAGRWMGTRNVGGGVAGLTANLIRSESGWAGTANLDGEDVPLRSVSLQGNHLTLSLSGGKGSLQGTLSADGRTFRGTVTSIDGPGPFTLRHQ
jgi:hypothetical protein